MRPGPQVDALREVLTETLAIPEVREYFDGRFLLLDLVGDGSIDAAVDGADRVRLVHRPVPDPDAAALLVRPDGYVAWAGADTTGLRDALDQWYAV
ncbi:hypothetical protein [Streptomyces acidicola]|uniref:aromatic-ring hydroxylase C-terminal domain-containing protein n=1 Tax=Streptomyces acidicola TaxID=2596892 RepID=UPI003437B9B4